MEIENGEVLKGRKEIEKKMIDGIGGEEEEVEWIKKKGMQEKMNRIEWKKVGREKGFQMSDIIINEGERIMGMKKEEDGEIKEIERDRILIEGII